MTPYLVTAPASLPVSLADMKAHLRVDFTDDDDLIAAQQGAAIAYLDGFGGVLGRCIMPQTWAVDLIGPGPHLLPFPDASGVSVDAAGNVLASETALTSMGWIVTIEDASEDQAVTISAEYGLSTERLPAAQMLVKLIVGGWYQNREAVTEGSISALPMAAEALIAALRWRSA